MNTWLYILSSSSGELFKKGERVSYSNFLNLYLNNGFKKINNHYGDSDWRIYRNFDKIKINDELLIYFGVSEGDRGIIANCKITDKNTQNNSITFIFNDKNTRTLISDPVPANLIRKFLGIPRFNVRKCNNEIINLLPWNKKYKEKTLGSLSKLKLHTPKAIEIEEINNQKRILSHDNILISINQYLKENNYTIGTKNFKGLRTDLVAYKGSNLIIVEAKKIIKNKGRNEAREGLGQLLEYSWLFKNDSTRKLSHHLWLAFDKEPQEDVYKFLKSLNITVSWLKEDYLYFPKLPTFM